MVDLSTDFIQSREPLRIYDFGGYQFLKCSPRKGVSMPDLRAAVLSEIAGVADLEGLDQNTNKTSYTVIVRAHKGKRPDTRAALQRLGKRWA